MEEKVMDKIKNLCVSILHTEVIGVLFIILNKFITNSKSFLPESFILNKTLYEAYGLVAFLFMLLGVIQYYVVILYDKMNWKIASLLDYIIEVMAILLVLFYLEFIGNIMNLIVLYIIISFLFIIRWVYYYRKFS